MSEIKNINVERVSALPGTLAADTLYFVKADGASTGTIYLTNNDGTISPSAMGEPGPAGADGLGFTYSGSGVPDNGLGSDGDTYVATNGDTYIKVTGAWALDDSIKGPQGDAGADGATGAAGADGIDGADGADGADGFISGYRLVFSSTTTDADPGAGVLRFNNATPASVTFIYIDNTDAAAGDITGFLDGLDDSTTPDNKGYLRIEKSDNPLVYLEFKIIGSVVDGTGYRKVPVEYVAHAGSLADANDIVLTSRPTGDKGADGAGAGDVVGPASAIDSNFAAFDTTTGKLIKDSGVAAASFATAAQGALADSAQQPPSEGAFVNGDKTKLDYLTVTQAVDLDQMETDIAALANGMVYKGDWDASSGSFPGSGAAQVGWFYNVSVGGTVDGVEFSAGDSVIATTDNASTTTYTGNWTKKDQTDAVQSVAGLIGTISASSLRTALNVEDGADVTDTANVTAAGALMDSEIASLASVKAINQGLATSDSPQFAGVNLGHATDTTLARIAAGRMSIEGAEVATLTGTQTLTNKTIASHTITGTPTETVFPITDGAGFSIAPANGSIQTITLGANRTPVAGTWANGQGITLMVDDGSAYTITWTTVGVTWVTGSAPTLQTSGYTVIVLWKVGGVIYGLAANGA